MSVHELRREVPLTDIPGRLRKIADEVEAGTHKPDLVLVVMRLPDAEPPTIATHALGNYYNDFECDGLMMRAALNGRF